MNTINLRLTLFSIITLTSCGLDCVDKKTGIQRSSQTIEQSKEKEIYQFQMSTNRQFVKVDNERKLVIKNAWIENTWLYDCIDNRAVLKKQIQFQMVIDGEYERPESDTMWYTLWADKNNFGVVLGGQLTFDYTGQDTLKMTLCNDQKKPIDTLKFWKTD
jgi:hypothetical protein